MHYYCTRTDKRAMCTRDIRRRSQPRPATEAYPRDTRRSAPVTNATSGDKRGQTATNGGERGPGQDGRQIETDKFGLTNQDGQFRTDKRRQHAIEFGRESPAVLVSKGAQAGAQTGAHTGAHTRTPKSARGPVGTSRKGYPPALAPVHRSLTAPPSGSTYECGRGPARIRPVLRTVSLCPRALSAHFLPVCPCCRRAGNFLSCFGTSPGEVRGIYSLPRPRTDSAAGRAPALPGSPPTVLLLQASHAFV